MGFTSRRPRAIVQPHKTRLVLVKKLLNLGHETVLKASMDDPDPEVAETALQYYSGRNLPSEAGLSRHDAIVKKYLDGILEINEDTTDILILLLNHSNSEISSKSLKILRGRSDKNNEYW